MEWRMIVVILCIYGFFKEFRPLEPFLTPYLRSDSKNFTDVELYSRVYPVWTYSSLACLVPTFLLTDLLRYNIILVFGALCYASTWLLLIYGTTVSHMQLMQFFYGFATATEIAYYGYSYAAIDPIHYKKSTSYVRCVLQLGKLSAYTLGQILVSTKLVKYIHLNYIALAGSTLIFVVALLLPCISWKKSIDRMRQVHEKKEDGPTENEPMKPFGSKENEADVVVEAELKRGISKEEVKTYRQFVRFYFMNMWTVFKKIYSTGFMWKWSLWSALMMCGMFQVTNYIQTLWDLFQISHGDVWNGVVEAINTLLAAVIVASMQFLTVKWSVWGEITMGAIAIIDCVLLVIMARSGSLVAIYILYTIYHVLYETMFTIALYNIAKHLATESFGLVFGFNTFIALALQTLLTVAVADERGLALDIRIQFIVYGAYHCVIAIAFLAMGIRTLVIYFRDRRQECEEGRLRETPAAPQYT